MECFGVVDRVDCGSYERDIKREIECHRERERARELESEKEKLSGRTYKRERTSQRAIGLRNGRKRV